MAYLRRANAVRRAAAPQGEEMEDLPVVEADAEEPVVVEGEMDVELYARMSASEQFILTLSENGYGKRTSSYEYRVTGRGGKGIVAMAVNERNGRLAASFPVENQDQIML